VGRSAKSATVGASAVTALATCRTAVLLSKCVLACARTVLSAHAPLPRIAPNLAAAPLPSPLTRTAVFSALTAAVGAADKVRPDTGGWCRNLSPGSHRTRKRTHAHKHATPAQAQCAERNQDRTGLQHGKPRTKRGNRTSPPTLQPPPTR
jgi:hypothetical protein